MGFKWLRRQVRKAVSLAIYRTSPRRYFEKEDRANLDCGYPERNTHWFRHLILPDFLDYLRKIFGGLAELNLLDVGCAHGYFTEEFGPYFKTVTGIDFARNRIAYAREKHSKPNVQYVHSDLTTFKFIEKFDVMFSNAMIPHIPAPRKEKVFRNLRTGMKAGGYFLMYDCNSENVTLTGDFVDCVSPQWLEKHVSDVWRCESCERIELPSKPYGTWRFVLRAT